MLWRMLDDAVKSVISCPSVPQVYERRGWWHQSEGANEVKSVLLPLPMHSRDRQL